MRCFLLLGCAMVAGCTPQVVPQPAPAPEPKPAPLSEPKSNPIAWSPEMQTIAEGNNQFACDLFAELRKEPGNLFFSPFSIHTALAMTADGAQGETLDEMVKVLHLPKEANARLAAGDVARYYAAGGEGYELAVSNHLWGQQGFPWKADFLERQRTRYGAELTPLDFIDDANREVARQTINAAIEKQTRDKIKELLLEKDLSKYSRLVLTNAIYFKGEWDHEFDKKATKEAPFTLADGTKKNLPLMTIQRHFHYLETESFQVVEMPYKGDAISMVVLLPRKHDGLPALETQLSAKNVDSWLKAMAHTSDVVLHLPKFKNESRFQLGEVLERKMGMPLAFDKNNADLKAMALLAPSDNLYISKVIHQSLVEVNEEGTEAAAATAVVMGFNTLSLRKYQDPKIFRADHPFLYLIRDTRTGIILFLGRYAGP